MEFSTVVTFATREEDVTTISVIGLEDREGRVELTLRSTIKLEAYCRAIALRRDGMMVVTEGLEGETQKGLRFLYAPDGRIEEATRAETRWHYNALSFLADGMLAGACEDGTLSILDPDKEEILDRRPLEFRPSSLAVSAGGLIGVSGNNWDEGRNKMKLFRWNGSRLKEIFLTNISPSPNSSIAVRDDEVVAIPTIAPVPLIFIRPQGQTVEILDASRLLNDHLGIVE